MLPQGITGFGTLREFPLPIQEAKYFQQFEYYIAKKERKLAKKWRRNGYNAGVCAGKSIRGKKRVAI
ncbi:MAG: hypothetical protein ACOX7N_03810 [Lawsonibacter sp.]|jgi:hypothetical protein